MEEQKPSILEAVCKQVARFYERLEKIARENSIHTQSVEVSRESDIPPEVKPTLDYCVKKAKEFYDSLLVAD